MTTSEGLLIIGGKCWGRDCEDNRQIIALYNDDGWTRLDDLHSKREGHRAIVNGDKIVVIGGSGDKQYTRLVQPYLEKKLYSHYFRSTEIWSIAKNGKKNIQLVEPKLSNYSFYPELFLVDINFCVKP